MKAIKLLVPWLDERRAIAYLLRKHGEATMIMTFKEAANDTQES